jgi:hypothetical protein
MVEIDAGRNLRGLYGAAWRDVCGDGRNEGVEGVHSVMVQGDMEGHNSGSLAGWVQEGRGGYVKG